MDFYFWYQTRGESAWHLAQSEQRRALIAEKCPAYTTVLDVSDIPEDDWGREQYINLKYVGPFYMDWDAEDVEDAIADFQTTLLELKEKGLNLECCRLYATGGRGFHMEVPMDCFLSKPAKSGLAQLPAIYRSMAEKYQTDTTDMRVYTARRGRMWRTPNVQRDNGRYKVPITPDEALEMTPEAYAEITAQPRHNLVEAEPEFCMELAVEFAQAKTRVDRQLSVRRRAKDESGVLSNYPDRLPPVARSIAAGIGYNPDKGFNQIALQLAITYSAANKDSEQFMQDCAGLIQNHKGDGSRYNTPRKRREALLELFHYVSQCDLYAFSVAGLRAVCDPATAAAEFGDAEGAYSPYEEEAPEDEQESAKPTLADFSRFQGVYIRPNGIFRKGKDDDIDQALSSAGISNPRCGADLEGGEVVSLVADVTGGSGQTRRDVSIPLEAFNSAKSLDKFLSGHVSGFVGTDTQVSIVRQILMEQACKEGKLIYVVHREGLEFVDVPDKAAKGGKRTVKIWVSPGRTVSAEPLNTDEGVQFQFKPLLSHSAVFDSDLLEADDLKGTPEEREWFRNLLNINAASTIGPALGWFAACFQRQAYHREWRQFPLLHPVGQAGAGKTQTVELLSHLFYHANRPPVMASGTSTTPFAIKSALVASSSIPLVLDEYKPAELGRMRRDLLTGYFRNAFNQSSFSTGGVSNGSATASWRDVRHLAASAPVCYIGETPEMQTAVAERSVQAHFTKAGANYDAWLKVQGGENPLASLGKALVVHALTETRETFRERFLHFHEKAVSAFKRNLNHRLAFNAAVVMHGLDTLRLVLGQHYGTALDVKLLELQQAAHDACLLERTEPIPEYAMTLSAMALNTRHAEIGAEYALEEGRDYCYVNDGEYLDIAMQDAYTRFRHWVRHTDGELLFPSMAGFISAFEHLPHLVVDTHCPTSPLRATGSAARRIFRFRVSQMRSENIELPKSKTLG